MRFFIATLLLLVFCSFPVFAEEEVLSPPTPVQYQLPYPGALPDNPLYPLKTLRDKVMSLLISDPLKKAEFDVDAADKRVSAGMYLFRKGKVAEAETVISKGENYFEDALAKATEAKKQGMHTTEIAVKLLNASAKHTEVLRDLTAKAKGEYKDKFTLLTKRAENLEKRANQQNLKGKD